MTDGDSRAKDIFSTHDAAKICRVTPMTVIRWIKEGKIPAFQTAGGHRRIVRADLARFCKTRGIPFAPDAEPEAGRVLVVERDAATRHAIADAARKACGDLSLEAVGDAWSAGQALATFRPNLVFLEQRLPGIDALEITARLARERDVEAPAVVVLVTEASADDERQLKARGAIACIVKPPSDAAVARVVRATFQLDAGNGATTVFVVEGDARAGRALRRELEERIPGCRVMLFDSPVEALIAMAGERPDLLLMDLSDVDLAPTEVLRRVAALPGDPPLAVVAIGKNEALRPAALRAGARAFLLKPWKIDQVVSLIRRGPTIASSVRRR